VDQIYYSFIYFCPPAGTNPMPYWAVAPYGSCTDSSQYTLMSVEPADASYIPTIVNYKSQNPNLKVILSVGGWNFPSSYFSKMVSSAANRQIFINSCVQWLQQYKCDGIDLDWEYPCSAPRNDEVEISCTQFREVDDAGGVCPDDTTNIVSLVADMRAAFGSKYLITIASQAAKSNEDKMNVAGLASYIDAMHVMTYDYTVSDLPGPEGAMMSPNAPLFTPPSPALQMSIASTIQDYINAGVPRNKLMPGIPFYGHTWYAPNLIGTNNWQKFGNNGQIQGACCGPFQQTYGGKYGKGSLQCGLYMYSEVQAAQPMTYYDTTTQSMIGFLNTMSVDGWTTAGTWLTYNDNTSVSAITQWAKTNGLGGVFIFDTSMDSMSGSQFTYQLMNTIADVLGGHGNSSAANACDPATCTVCAACCSSSITTQAACDSCVSANCGGNPCSGKPDNNEWCVNDSTYVNCPSGITQSCAPSTCCQQSGNYVYCDWCT